MATFGNMPEDPNQSCLTNSSPNTAPPLVVPLFVTSHSLKNVVYRTVCRINVLHQNAQLKGKQIIAERTTEDLFLKL